MRHLIHLSGRWCILFLLSISAITSLASEDPPVIKRLDGSKGQLKPDSAMTVEDKFFNSFYAGKIGTPFQVKNIITFRINEDTTFHLASAFDASVNIKVILTHNDLSIDSFNTTLTIKYNPAHDSTYKGRSYIVIDSFHKVKVKITSFTISDTTYTKSLLLENEMRSFPTYIFSCDENAIKSLALVDPANGNTDERRANWANMLGADEYDLEYTYIDIGAADDYKDGSGNYIPSKIFDDNATRITTTSTKYRIPLMFPDTGILFARVRPVQIKPDGSRIAANWSSDYISDGGLAQWSFNGHEEKLNWQSSVTFAEGGKRKTVLQYYDGNGKSRQTVTKDESINTTVVSETFYDAQGRPVIQVMPVPTLSNIIKYTKNFNVDINGAEYDKGRYDTLLDPSAYCNTSAQAMSTDSGAARYYSPQNPDTTYNNRFIPDAHGYAFTETEYTQDNTGRISRQSGVDTTFKLGSGHETKYYYGTPDQREIDALFGTEAGDYTHYFKNMVRDANGQFSVSYTDMHGRTIATALAGLNPPGMDTLASYKAQGDSITETLSTPASNLVSDFLMQSQKSLLVTRSDKFYFHYDLSPKTLINETCTEDTACYDCLYDLEIIITDDCNNQKLPGDTAYHKTIRNFTMGSIDTLKNDSVQAFSFNDSLQLEPGNYEITKKLSVSRAALDYYRDSVYMHRNTCYDLQHFINVQPHEQCAPDCQSCYEDLGTLANFRNNFMDNNGLTEEDTAGYRDEIWASYQSALSACKALCDSAIGDNEFLREAMLRDVSAPSGQYANLAAVDRYSVFSDLLSTPPPYQRDTITYLDEFGRPDHVLDDRNGQMVLPQELDAQQFALKFKASWAEALLPFHPEYCKYIEYQKHIDSYNWDKDFLKVETYVEAEEKGYLIPVGIDPLAQESNANETYLSGKVNNYAQVTLTENGSPYNVSLETLACMTTTCQDDEACISDWVINSKGFDDLGCDGDRDMAWRKFKGLYLAIKQDFVDNLISDPNNNCPAGHPLVLMSDLLVRGHFLNFNNSDSALAQNGLDHYLTANEENATDSAKAAIEAQYDQNCRNYVNIWWQQLAPCNYTAADSAVIVPRLIEVCKRGSDAEHPYGSRTIRPDTTYEYPDFDAVIKAYNASIGKEDLITCNADLISVPKQYDAQLVYSNKPVWTKPSECECEKINALYDQYRAHFPITRDAFKGKFFLTGHGSPLTWKDISNKITGDEENPTFSEFLLQYYQTTISDEALGQLLAMCDDIEDECKYLTAPISLPPAFQCYSGDVCLDCNRFNILYQEFQDTYDVVPVADAPGDTTHRQVNELFARFMNNKLSYIKEAADYLAFKGRCDAVSGDIHCVGCDDLQQLINDYFNQLTENAGSEEEMLEYIYNHLGMQVTTTRIKQALSTCNTGWENNIALRGPYVFVKDQGNLNIGSDSTKDFTMEFWANFDNTSGVLPLLYWNSFKTTTYWGSSYHFKGYYIYADTYQSKKYLFARFGDYTNKYIHVHSTDTLKPFQWYHIIITRSGNQSSGIKIYLNSVQSPHILAATLDANTVTNAALTNGSITPVTFFNPALSNGSFFSYADTGMLILHNSWTAYDHNYNTWMKNLRLYSRVLPDSEIVKNYQSCNGVPSNKDSLKLWAKFNEGTGMPKDYSVHNTGGSWFKRYDSFFESITDVKKAMIFGGKGSPSCLPQYSAVLCDYPFANSLLLCGKSEPIFNDTIKQIDNCSDSTFFATTAGNALFAYYKDSLKNSFENAYLDKCMQAYKLETFTVRHAVVEHHYTLYYYDQAGNLVKTVPPQGVNVIRRDSWLDSVQTARVGGDALVPAHALITQYRYNSLNQVIAQKTPDAGKTVSYYDRLGRLVLQQNAKQKPEDKYSYTFYDALGRITEVGELQNAGAMNSEVSRDTTHLKEWLEDAAATCTQITRTTYDEKYSPIDTLMDAKNLRNRVAYTALYNEATDIDNLNHAAATYYSYDIHGNVDTLVQDYKSGSMAANQNRFKKVVYNYDLISGKVNFIAYQPGFVDAFYHRYVYDEENRLTDVETSSDSIYWEHDAYYKYYKHGPLSRTVLGTQQVQGLDYAYTLQGWLKGINSSALSPNNDMGGDGKSNANVIGRDVFGLTLYYFGNGDYVPVTTGKKIFANALTANFYPLFNGNIAAMGVNISAFSDPYLYNYKYDQLNRLTAMKAASKGINATTNVWNTPGTSLKNYKETISYDANGNILRYDRYNASAIMDSLTYSYYAGTNRLNNINDKVTAYTTDIHNHGLNNYRYDGIGNLTKDSTEGIDSVYWNVYGKQTQVNKHDGTVITYTYDAGGNRISEKVNNKETWYVRDATGNVLSVYSKGYDSINGGQLTQTEVDAYGSSRLGVRNRKINVQNITPPTQIYLPGTNGQYATMGSFERGNMRYEITDHRGNVMAVISDKKTSVSSDGVKASYYNADVMSATDYSSYGAGLRGRDTIIGNLSGYYYGLNGQRKDKDIQKDHYTAKFWEYDPRTGRRWNVEPLGRKYPMWSPYIAFANNPIKYIDRDGAEPGDVVVAFGGGDWQMNNDKGRAPNIIQKVNAAYIEKYGGQTQSFASKFWNVSPKSERDLNKATQAAYDFIKANYNKQDGKDVEGGKIIIEGYSMGGVLANHLAKRLGEDGIQVDLLITVDAAAAWKTDEVNRTVSSNVKKNINIYQTKTSIVGSRGDKNKASNKNTDIVNNDYSNHYTGTPGQKDYQEIEHGTIDDMSEGRVINEVVNELGNRPKK